MFSTTTVSATNTPDQLRREAAFKAIANFADNPYFRLAKDTAASYTENHTEAELKEFANSVGAFLAKTSIDDGASALADLSDEFYTEDDDEESLRISNLSTKSQDELLNIRALGDGDLLDAARSVKELDSALSSLCEYAKENDFVEEMA